MRGISHYHKAALSRRLEASRGHLKVPRAVALLLGLCMLVMNACAPKKTLDFQQRVAIYERAGIQFTNAILFKPAETVFTNTLGFKLAPLLLLEVTNTNETSVMPAVYFEESRMQLNGRSYDQVTFTWHPPPPGGAKAAAPSVQGIRLTLIAFRFAGGLGGSQG